jgi:DNA-binding response OmpR family regulator
VLVVLDRPVLVELISLTLNHGVCSVRTATAVEHVASLATEWQPHLLILDMALNGSLIMQQVRTRAGDGASMLVLGLLAGTDLRGKLAAFDDGADDILTVPFAPEELLARVIALMQRSRTAPIVLTPTITVGELQIDILYRTVRVGDDELHLSPLELALLYLLAAIPGRVLTREEILATLWGADDTAQTKLVDQYIHNLRARLQTDSRRPRFIATVPGRG